MRQFHASYYFMNNAQIFNSTKQTNPELGGGRSGRHDYVSPFLVIFLEMCMHSRVLYHPSVRKCIVSVGALQCCLHIIFLASYGKIKLEKFSGAEGNAIWTASASLLERRREMIARIVPHPSLLVGPVPVSLGNVLIAHWDL